VRLLNLMVGELDSSHLGVGAVRDPHAARSGYLGAEFDAAYYRRTHHLRIAEMLPLGPLGLSGRVHVGDELEAVDGTPLDAHANIEALLEDKIGKRIVIRVNGHDVPVSPIDGQAAAALRYRAWVDSRRALVDRLSGGRLGYVHIFDMSEESLARLAIDLDIRNQTKAGVVIDIRNNEGGFVDPYVTDVFSRRNYVNFKDRGRPIVPERRRLDNEHSIGRRCCWSISTPSPIQKILPKTTVARISAKSWANRRPAGSSSRTEPRSSTVRASASRTRRRSRSRASTWSCIPARSMCTPRDVWAKTSKMKMLNWRLQCGRYSARGAHVSITVPRAPR